jgi:hypothetical protein
VGLLRVSIEETQNPLTNSTPAAAHLINNTELAETERRILEYQEQNADFIAQKAARQASDRTSAMAREEAARKERQLAAKQAQEEEEELLRRMETLKQQAFESIARGETGTEYYKEMEKLRAGAEEQSAANHRLRKKAARSGTQTDTIQHAPTSPSYAGPFVPLPFSYFPSPAERHLRPDLSAIPTLPEMGTLSSEGVESPRYRDIDYIDRQLKAHETWSRVRAGGFDIREIWDRDLRSALEGLLVPLVSWLMTEITMKCHYALMGEMLPSFHSILPVDVWTLLLGFLAGPSCLQYAVSLVLLTT